ALSTSPLFTLIGEYCRGPRYWRSFLRQIVFPSTCSADNRHFRLRCSSPQAFLRSCCCSELEPDSLLLRVGLWWFLCRIAILRSCKAATSICVCWRSGQFSCPSAPCTRLTALWFRLKKPQEPPPHPPVTSRFRALR